jgi:hypothetical protein
MSSEARRPTMSAGPAAVLGAVFNLNSPAHVVHWHFINLTVSNVVVIAVMLVVFALAVVLPFPGAASREKARGSAS